MRRLALPVGFFLGLLPSLAQASGFLVARFGGEEGHPASDDPTSIYFNPAGLALGHGTRVYAEGIFAYRSMTYVRPPDAIDHLAAAGQSGTPADAVAANAGKATLGNALAAPFVGIVTDFGVRNLGVGAAFYVPFGGSASWDPNAAFRGSGQYPGAVDGVQRWALIEGSLTSSYVTVAGAYEFPRLHLSVGVGLNVVLSQIDTINARNPTSTDDLTTAGGGIQEGRSLLEVSGTELGASAGIHWQPAPNVWIGASYQSQPGFGEMRLDGTLTNKFGSSAASPTPVALLQSLPDVARLGARVQVSSRTELHVSGELVHWSVFQRQCAVTIATASAGCQLGANGQQLPGSGSVPFNLERDWRNTVAVRAGGSYRLGENLALQLGAGYDMHAAPDSTMDAGLGDQDTVSFAAGARYRWSPSLLIAATFSQYVFLDRTVAARSRNAMGQPTTLDLPSRVPDGAGTYSQQISSLNLSAQYSF